MNKTCSLGSCQCQHACLGSTFIHCNYCGYCDYQLPKDSRSWQLTEPDKEQTKKGER